jgi:hypothetical protein
MTYGLHIPKGCRAIEDQRYDNDLPKLCIETIVVAPDFSLAFNHISAQEAWITCAGDVEHGSYDEVYARIFLLNIKGL